MSRSPVLEAENSPVQEIGYHDSRAIFYINWVTQTYVIFVVKEARKDIETY